jgi:hypothetical protein
MGHKTFLMGGREGLALSPMGYAKKTPPRGTIVHLRIFLLNLQLVT